MRSSGRGESELQRFKPYPAYKDSGIEWLGEIPAHWEVVPFKRLLTRCDYGISEGFAGTGGVRVLTMAHIQDGEVILPESGSVAEVEDQLLLDQHDLLFNRTNSRELVGKVGMFRGSRSDKVSFASYLVRMTVREGISPTYLNFLLNSSGVLGLARSMAMLSVNQANLNPTRYTQIQVPRPVRGEQEVIAAFLDREKVRIDALVAKKERLIELLQEKRTALITRAVTKGLDPNVPMKDSGVEWLGEIPAHWEVKRVRHVVRRIEQGWSPDCENREADEDEWGVLKAGCVNRGIFIESEHKALPAMLEPIPELEIAEGDLLMSRASGSRDLVGSVAVVPECRPRLLLCDKVFRLHVKAETAVREFLAYAMNSRIARWQIEVVLSGGSGLANNIAQEVVKDLTLAQPALDEQRTIAAFLDRETVRIDALVAKVRHAIDRLKELRTALISAAVTGKIDVREEAA